ncbi:MAG: hypothetical protein ACOYLS_02870 [Polymorphobacter sp.]
MTDPLTHAAVEATRRSPGQSLLLFITDRCPVGCAHCSVDSRPDSPAISDFALFEAIVGWIAARPGLRTVGISGGEPFVERRGLTFASTAFAAAGLSQVIFTSGVWARQRVAPWVDDVLARCATVYLSTDAFHARSIDATAFARAAAAIAATGAWIVVQALDHHDNVARATAAIRAALGDNWRDHAEINPVTPLTNGRGASQFHRAATTPGHAFGPCRLAASPTIRYDGAISACCNESVLRGHGPARLRARAANAAALPGVVNALATDAMVAAIATLGLGLLTEQPRFVDLADRNFASDCDLCWAMFDRLPAVAAPDPLLTAMAALAGGR